VVQRQVAVDHVVPPQPDHRVRPHAHEQLPVMYSGKYEASNLGYP
jgi:hypothetical protein